MKKLHPSRSSKYLNTLVIKIKEHAQNSDLITYEFTLDKIKESLLPEGNANKLALIEEVTQRYADLALELENEKSKKTHYSLRMFEAVAVGIVCSHYLTREHKVVKQINKK